jgi:hypothetical protein
MNEASGKLVRRPDFNRHWRPWSNFHSLEPAGASGGRGPRWPCVTTSDFMGPCGMETLRRVASRQGCLERGRQHEAAAYSMKAAKTNAEINATTAIAIRARKKWVMRGDAGIAISFDREKMPRQLRRPSRRTGDNPAFRSRLS